MPFVRRAENGRIHALLRAAAPDATEQLPIDHPEIVEFLAADSGSKGNVELQQSDLDIIRVVEDLIDVLLDKKLILLTDLPRAAQQKLLRRKNLRAALTPISDVLDPGEDDIL